MQWLLQTVEPQKMAAFHQAYLNIDVTQKILKHGDCIFYSSPETRYLAPTADVSVILDDDSDQISLKRCFLIAIAIAIELGSQNVDFAYWQILVEVWILFTLI